MATPTDIEQLILQLVNRARADPTGEVNRLITNFATKTGANSEITQSLQFFGVDANLMAQQLAGTTPKAPLAWNSALNDAATGHSAKMIQTNSQSHQVAGELDLGARIQAAGYTGLSAGGENIFAFASTPLGAHAGFYIDWGGTVGGMQSPPGHRNNILSASFTEIGIDATPVASSLPNVGPLVVTEDFGSTFNYKPQFVGVVINDLNGNNFYDIGEGLGGVTVRAVGSAGTFTTTTFSSGGYNLQAPAGTYTITFSGGALASAKTATATIGTANVAVDAITRGAVVSTVPTTGNDTFASSGAALTLDGLAGLDSVTYTKAHTAFAITGVTTATTTVTSSGVTDRFTNIERLVFTDEVIALDINGNAGQAYRMYQAAFARTPDRDGVSFWVKQVDSNMSLQTMAQNFITSAEFKGIYGTNPSVTQLVTGFYTNVLGRAPDASGLNFWVGQVQNGLSTANLLVSFSESAENKAHVAPAVQNGIELTLSFFA